MEMEEGDEKNKETYVVGALGDVHTTWSMIDFKMSVVAATWESKNALKIRLEEKTQVSLNSLTNLGEVLYSQNQFSYFKDPSLPFIGRSVRKDGFKLEGGELFKGVFANCTVPYPGVDEVKVKVNVWGQSQHKVSPRWRDAKCQHRQEEASPRSRRRLVKASPS